ncbi:hypothetical protein RRG08_010391 [Elysia crispata]|uniref:3-beta hydroxysteroid dehydrogenase/isomerase domain-containing protein n=1 Tax=Elysia crispata TaxID=231223 RepID=A0AAE1EDE9_9GAST|nr:hypothetical protein RRG08_010391 [Elysia crispata]
MVVTRSEAKQRKEIHVVTGGGGFPGFTLGRRLAQSGHHVRLLDITEPVWELEDGMEFIKGSVVDKAVVAEAIAGASAVYHMASYGMSGKSQFVLRLSAALRRNKFDDFCSRSEVWFCLKDK